MTVGADIISAGTVTFTAPTTSAPTRFSGTLSNLTITQLNVNTGNSQLLAKLSIEASGLNVTAINVSTLSTLFVTTSTLNSAITLQGIGNNEGYGALRLDGSTISGSIILAANLR